MKIVIIKYNAGNVYSLKCALDRIGVESIISSDTKEILDADKVIFPGVGETSSTMSFLKETKLDETIKKIKNPFLGICLGMQLLGEYSEENSTECLNILEEKSKIFNNNVKVPHIGWNKVYNYNSVLFSGIPENTHFYFVHSYYLPNNKYTIGKCEYGIEFSAAIQKNNFYGVQFHPEKSSEYGQKLLENFIKI